MTPRAHFPSCRSFTVPSHEPDSDVFPPGPRSVDAQPAPPRRTPATIRNTLDERVSRTGCRERPNGLRVSRQLEGTTFIDRESHVLLLDAKIAPIQPLRWNAVLDGDDEIPELRDMGFQIAQIATPLIVKPYDPD